MNTMPRVSSTSPGWPSWPTWMSCPTCNQYRASSRNGHFTRVPLHRLLVAPVRLTDGGVFRTGA